MFSLDYYSKRNLDLQVKGFTAGEHRLDMKVILKDKENKEVYKTTNTYELLSLNVNAENDETIRFFKKISTDYLSLLYKENGSNSDNTTDNGIATNCVLWYIKDTSYEASDSGNTPVNPNPKPTIGGNTVGDQINCINSKNIGGIYQGEENHSYPTGLFYYYEGYWWQNCSTNFQGGKPGDHNNRHWKKIDSYFDFNSYYEKGDILINKTNNEQYVWLQNYPNIDSLYQKVNTNEILDIGESTGDSWRDEEQKKYIKKVSELTEEEKKDLETHDCSKYWSSYRDDTVAKNLNKVNLDNVPDYKSTSLYTVNISIVRMLQSGKNATSVKNKYDYQYYFKVFDGNGSKPGFSAASGWEILDRSFHEESSYKKGDIVYYGRNSVQYIRALKDVNVKTNVLEEIYTKHEYWEEVK